MGSITGTEDVGGLIGFNTGDINSSYSTGDVTGTDFVGGLGGIGHGHIEQSFSSGNVIGTQYVGGLIGGSQGYISDSYAIGNVTGTGGNVGGLIGLLERTGGDNGSVSNSYAIGEVSGNSNVGGLIGGTYGSITCDYSYYDSTTTGQSDTGKGMPKTTVQMIKQSTFEGWDFGTVWTMDTDPASYPYFQWQTENIPLVDFTSVTLGESVMTHTCSVRLSCI